MSSEQEEVQFKKKNFHSEMKTELLDHIFPGWDGYQSLLIRLKTYLSDKQIHCSSTDSSVIFEYLEQGGHMHIGKYDVLKKVLEGLHVPAVEVINKYEQKISELEQNRTDQTQPVKPPQPHVLNNSTRVEAISSSAQTPVGQTIDTHLVPRAEYPCPLPNDKQGNGQRINRFTPYPKENPRQMDSTSEGTTYNGVTTVQSVSGSGPYIDVRGISGDNNSNPEPSLQHQTVGHGIVNPVSQSDSAAQSSYITHPVNQSDSTLQSSNIGHPVNQSDSSVKCLNIQDVSPSQVQLQPSEVHFKKTQLHNELKTELLGSIFPDWSNYSSIITRLQTYLSPAQIAKCRKDAGCIFEYLEQKGKMAIGKYDVLKQILNGLHMPAINKIENFQQKMLELDH